MPLVELLLEHRSPLNATDVSGLSALHHGELCTMFDASGASRSSSSSSSLGRLLLRKVVKKKMLERKEKLTRNTAISEGHGDAAMALLRAGAESDKRDGDGYLAIDLAPDRQVSVPTETSQPCEVGRFTDILQIRQYILQAAEREEIDITTS